MRSEQRRTSADFGINGHMRITHYIAEANCKNNNLRPRSLQHASCVRILSRPLKLNISKNDTITVPIASIIHTESECPHTVPIGVHSTARA